MAETLYAIAREFAGADGRRDRLRPLLRHRHDRARARAAGAHRLGRRDLRGVGRLRDRERRAERDHECRVLRRQRLARARGAARARRPAGRRRRRSAARRARRQGAPPDGAAAGAADRLRVVQPDDARVRPEGAARGLRLRAAPLPCRSTCSRTRRTSRASTCSSWSSVRRRRDGGVGLSPRSRTSRPRCRQCPQSRSAFGSRNPSAIAGRAGRPSKSNTVVRISVSESSPTIDSQVQPTRRPKRAAAARKRAKKRMSGGPMFAEPVLAGQPERDRDALEQARLLGDDVVRRPSPDRERVDPRDHRRRSARPTRAPRTPARTRNPIAVSARSFVTLNSEPNPTRSKSAARATRITASTATARLGATGSDEPRHRERDREDDERGDQDVGPEADVREHARPGIPGDERREDGGEPAARRRLSTAAAAPTTAQAP